MIARTDGNRVLSMETEDAAYEQQRGFTVDIAIGAIGGFVWLFAIIGFVTVCRMLFG